MIVDFAVTDQHKIGVGSGDERLISSCGEIHNRKAMKDHKDTVYGQWDAVVRPRY